MLPSRNTLDGPRPSLSLVVNADEFGLSPEVSRGILQAHRNGIVTSTSVLGNCPNLEEVKALLATAPALGVGVQLTLLRGLPISDPGSIPTADRAARGLRLAGARRVPVLDDPAI